jgi:2-haloacid dehalogenase
MAAPASDRLVDARPPIDTVVFDIGNVLIPWNPRWLFSKLLTDEAALDRFLEEVDFTAWNAQHDGGQSFAQGIAEQGARFPHYRHLLQAYFDRWEECIAEPLEESVALTRRLRETGYRTLALTNFSAETFPRALRLNPFLREFEGILVSGVEKLMKPDPAIYRLLCERYSVVPARCVFIDDGLRNVEGARRVGMHALHFRSNDQLLEDLDALGVRI